MSKEHVQANVTLIRKLMKTKELTIQALSDVMDTERTHLSAILNHRKPMTEQMRDRIADALGVPRESLMTTTEQLFIRRVEEVVLDFALGDAPVAVDLDKLTDIAIRFGIVQEHDPFASQDPKSEAQKRLERVTADL